MARSRKTGSRTTRRRGESARTAGRRNGAGTARRTRPPAARDAVAVLKQQHDMTRRLFRELSEAAGEDRRALFQQLADNLAAHATVEERLLYPELARLEGMQDVAHDAVEEHLIVKRLLADMLERDLDERVFEAKCRVLEVEVTRHVEEEEGALLPQARRALGKARLEELGQEIERTFEELVQQEPRRQVPRETESAPSLP